MPDALIDHLERLYSEMRAIEARNPGEAGITASLDYLRQQARESGFDSVQEAMVSLYSAAVGDLKQLKSGAAK